MPPAKKRAKPAGPVGPVGLAAVNAEPVELTYLPEHLVLTPVERVPFAGLLEAEPALRTSSLTREEWDVELAKYLASPRP